MLIIDKKLKQLRQHLDFEIRFLLPKIIHTCFKPFVGFGFNIYTYASCLYESKYGCRELSYFEYTPKFISLTYNGINLFLRPYPSSDLFVFRQVLVDYQYRLILDFIDFQNLGRSLRILDAGANIGLSSVFFLSEIMQRFNQDVSIYAIEPDDKNFDVLVRNTASFSSMVFAKKAALWHSEKCLNIETPKNNFGEWSTRVTDGNEDISFVDGVTVQGVMREMNWDEIDILKIDIEGSEFEVFFGQAADISFLFNIRFVVIEIHSKFGDKQAILQILIDHGFIIFHHGELTFAHRNKNS